MLDTRKSVPIVLTCLLLSNAFLSSTVTSVSPVCVQSAVERASQPKPGRTVMPEAAEKAKELLADEIRNAQK